MGPKTKVADDLHAMKYRGPGEDFREAMNRLAVGLKDNDAHYHEFREILLSMRFMPGGRVQSAIGATRYVTAFNCYVSGIIADSFVDGPGSIMERAHEAASTMRMGGGIGYDFSTLRPKGELIRRLQSHSSGPISFMRIFNEVCLATASSGHRRGAQMGVMRVDHPDIEEFVRAKQNTDKLTGFNISIAVTDAFMEAVYAGKEFDLTWGGKVYNTIDAGALWETIMRSTWDWAEPGILFIDRINRYNNLYYCETISATNPCAEQPLPPFGACLLGSFNLPQYLTQQGIYREGDTLTTGGETLSVIGKRYAFDFDRLIADIPAVVRAMDNVTDRTRYPLAQQRAEAYSKRRMGLGVTGLANCAEALGYVYGSQEFLNFEDHVLAVIEVQTYKASALLAKEKGPFPLFDENKYPKGEYIKTLPDDVWDLIDRYGIRNSHLTSIAPTGTISMCADNISSSIEPVFSFETKRLINTPDGAVEQVIGDYGAAFLGVRGRLSKDVTALEHVNVLAAAQRHVDSSVSKTCNVTGAMPWEDFKKIYLMAYDMGAKGCTTYNSDGKRGALLVTTEGDSVCAIDPETGRQECA